MNLTNEAKSNKYEYQSLPEPKSIRLLELEPCSSETETLRGKFLISELQEPHEYEAVSYTWGEPDFTESIKIDKFDIAITKNLATALRRFRLEDKPRLLWIDAICIAQNNDEEKSLQVALMADIYRKANAVLGWLEDGDGEAAKALHHFHELAHAAPQFGLDDEVDYSIFLRTPGILPKGSRAEIMALIDTAKSHQIELIYSRPWFTRIWIVQEVILARNLVLHCGMATLNWREFAAAILLLFQAQQSVKNGLVLNLHAFSMAWEIVVVRGERMVLTSKPPGNVMRIERNSPFSNPGSDHSAMLGKALVETIVAKLSDDQSGTALPIVFDANSMGRYNSVLAKFWKRDCKDDRDRIYGMLGICPWDVQIEIIPDYSKSVVEVYIDYARKVLEHQNLEILNFAGTWNRKPTPESSFCDGEDTCPSWVPEHRISKLKQRDNSTPWDGARMHPLWEYCVAQVMFPKKARSQRRVSLEGVFFDNIKVAMCSGGVVDPVLMLQLVVLCSKNAKEACPEGAYQLTGEDWLDAFVQTIDPRSDKSPAEYAKLLDLLVRSAPWIVKMMEEIANIPPGSSTAIIVDSQEDIELLDLAKSLISLFSRWSFITTNQGYMGLAPGVIHRNDVIVVFCGLPGPYLVRPVPGTLDAQLVGSCYVHGMMTGEYEYGDDYRWISLI